MKKKNILIFGVSGQDGSFLSKYLLSKNYNVFGVTRKKKILKNHIILGIHKKVKLRYFEYTNYEKIKLLILKNNISEVYFFAGQTKPVISNQNFIETLYSNIIPVYYILDIILKYKKNIRFFNSSSCEIFSSTNNNLKEDSKKDPQTIYGLSKLVSLEMVKFFREKYKLKSCSGIMFHHESVLREKSFVLKKIINSAKQISIKGNKKVKLGNINVSRDWGWAPEYVKLIYKINNQKKIEDLILATGVSTKLSSLIKAIFNHYNLNYKKYVVSDTKYMRKNETKIRKADNTKIKRKFNWKPKNRANEVVMNLINNRTF